MGSQPRQVEIGQVMQLEHRNRFQLVVHQGKYRTFITFSVEEAAALKKELEDWLGSASKP